MRICLQSLKSLEPPFSRGFSNLAPDDSLPPLAPNLRFVTFRSKPERKQAETPSAMPEHQSYEEQSMDNTWRKPWSLVLVAVLPVVFGLTSCGQPSEKSTTSTPSTTATGSPLSALQNSTPSPRKLPTASSPAQSTPASGTEVSKLGVAPQGEACPSTAPVKGKEGKRGKIYHLPNSPNYSQTKATVCFTDAATAEKAGYHAPKSSNGNAKT